MPKCTTKVKKPLIYKDFRSIFNDKKKTVGRYYPYQSTVPYLYKGYEKDIFLRFAIMFRTQTKNHGIAVDIINSEVIAYHQHEVLYIIKPQARCTLARDEIQGRLAALDDIHRTLCGDDIPSLRLG